MSDTDDLFEAVAKLARILPLDRQYELIARLAAQAGSSARAKPRLEPPLGAGQPRIFLVEDETQAQSPAHQVESSVAEGAMYKGKGESHDAIWASLEHYDIPTVLRQK